MNAARWAKRYCGLGMALVLVPPGQKGPRMPRWQRAENCVTDPQQALDIWTRKPVHGIACVLQHSGLVSVDVDDAATAEPAFIDLGVDLRALCAKTPTVVSRPGRYRMLFRAPAEPLAHHNVTWPEKGP